MPRWTSAKKIRRNTTLLSHYLVRAKTGKSPLLTVAKRMFWKCSERELLFFCYGRYWRKLGCIYNHSDVCFHYGKYSIDNFLRIFPLDYSSTSLLEYSYFYGQQMICYHLLLILFSLSGLRRSLMIENWKWSVLISWLLK